MAPRVQAADRCRPIEMLILDVDGVLTDGRITYTDDGVELKSFHVRDGTALVAWRRLGKRVALVSGRDSRAVERRAAELGVDVVVQGADDKRAAVRQILKAGCLAPAAAGFVGDDLADLPAFAECGLAVAVADACAEVKEAAHHVTESAGGHGAVRETVEWVLRCQGHWPAIVERYRGRE